MSLSSVLRQILGAASFARVQGQDKPAGSPGNPSHPGRPPRLVEPNQMGPKAEPKPEPK